MILYKLIACIDPVVKIQIYIEINGDLSLVYDLYDREKLDGNIFPYLFSSIRSIDVPDWNTISIILD